jgi:hypothetical protein
MDSVLIRYTLTGDLDLDLDIDGSDYALMDAGFAAGLTRYQDGDIDFSGVIDADDYFWMDRAYSNQGVTLAAMAAMSAGAVPEPGIAMGMLTVGAMLVGRRRRCVTSAGLSC